MRLEEVKWRRGVLSQEEKTNSKPTISAERGNIMKHTVNSHSTKRFVSILCALLLLLCMLAPVSAIGLTERTEQIPLTTQAVAESFSVSAERISLLDEDDDGHTFFVMDEQTFVYMSDANRATAQTFTADYDIELAVPCVGGIMLGSEQPIYVPDCEHTDSDCCDSDMRWNGVYQFLDYETGEATLINDPYGFYATQATNLVEFSNYSTTINGKAIPHVNYNPSNSTAANPVVWDWSGDYYSKYQGQSGKQCHGFGLFIYDYIYGEKGKKSEPVRLSSDNDAKTFLQKQEKGTLVRVNVSASVQHTFIIIGHNSSGVYIYHANWPENNVVNIHHATWSVFYDKFNDIEYCLAPCDHENLIASWAPLNSKLHTGTCSYCHNTVSQKHYALTAGSNVTCVRCGYVGAMDGLNRVGEEIE